MTQPQKPQAPGAPVRVALVTGCGKPDGMGRAIARALATAGVAVVVADKEPAGVLNRRQEAVGVAGQEDWKGVESLVEEITWLGGVASGVLGDIPVGRVGRPEDIAAAVTYLASDGGGFMTGQILVLDGGGLSPFPLARPAGAT